MPDRKLQKEIEEFNSRVLNFLWVVLLSVVTSVITVLLYTA